ncbi:MAG: 23S rRNA (uracil(1939)-C(5))-methyltransferase RlmD [Ruminococcus sp.]|nr:23S rRNA (uracil(1939)-C(5))-methyltransferase RlmD [Ruminococcus sp.]
MTKNDIIQLHITAMTSDGDGIGRTDDGMVVFVPNTAVGDVLRARILKVKKSVAYGKIEEILTPSDDRITPDCDVCAQCGGCVYRHISYDAELKLKRQKVIDAVTRIGGLSADLVKDIIPSKNINCYRNKAQIPVALDQNGKPMMGFYARHSHRIVQKQICKLSPEIFNHVAIDFYSFIEKYPQIIYGDNNRKGIRHLYLRYAESSGDVMVCVVAGREDFPHSKKIFNSLLEKYPSIKSIVINVNPEDTNVILGKKNRLVYGSETITDTLCGLSFDISPLSFYQVNRSQAERLYEKAREYAALTGKETLLDLYCGTGTIGLSMAKNCKMLIGAEIISDAVENAKKNAEKNGITNARFLCADAAQAAEQLRAEGIQPDVIVVDPPRKGLTPDLIETIARMAPERVVYVSCDPATLARDLKLFTGKNYSVKEITPCDMFPRTSHCESVCQLIRSDIKS